MIKKGILTLVLTVISTVIFAQSQNITSSAIIFKQYNSEKDKEKKATKISEAKKYIDLAFQNASTSDEPKMWMYRAQVYRAIAISHSVLDENAIFKATESYIKCMQPHPKKKNKIIIYKKWPKEEVLEGIVQCGYKLFNEATVEYNAGNHKRALKHYTAIFDIIPFDDEDQLKRGNITKETILYRSFLSTNKMKDNTASKEILQQLIDISFNEPKIYSDMSSILIEEENIDKALEYLALGRDMFEEDQGLINYEINLYIELDRTSELIDKLTNAILSDDENEVYYVIRGTCYRNLLDFDNAINDFSNAIRIDPDHTIALNNISSCYLKKAEPIVKKLNALNYNETSKYNKYKEELKNLYLKALPHLVHYLDLVPDDKGILNALGEIYYKLEMYKESKDIKGRIAELK